MAEIDSVAEKVRKFWSDQNSSIIDISEEQLSLASQRLGVELPAHYVRFLKIAGLPDDEDRDMFYFWHPHELRMMDQILAEAGCTDSPPESIGVADHAQESWWYSLCVSGRFRGLVFQVWGTDAPAEAFGQGIELRSFLEKYLEDDDWLYPPD